MKKFIDILRADAGYNAALAAAPDEETRRKIAAASEALAMKISEVLDPFVATATNNPDFAKALADAVKNGKK